MNTQSILYALNRTRTLLNNIRILDMNTKSILYAPNRTRNLFIIPGF